MRKLASVLIGVGTTVAAVAMTAVPADASQNAVVYAKACSYCRGEGYAQFMADPTNLVPGDSLKVCDVLSDGWGVIGFLENPATNKVIRQGSTLGHYAPWCTPWLTGDLPEQTHLYVGACLVKGTETKDCWMGEAWS